MQKNLDQLGCPERPDLDLAAGAGPWVLSAQPGQAAALREALAAAVAALASGQWPLWLGPPADAAQRAQGHFHLAPELFVQVSGSTQFQFPGGEHRLGPGELLLLPPQLLHAERVQAGAAGEPFRNLVIYAEAGVLSCHLAHELRPGVPGVLHLEARRHPQAPHVLAWLGDALEIGRPAAGTAVPAWAAAQQRALVTAALAGVLRALEEPAAGDLGEPPLVAGLRVLIRNQLGDQALSVRSLAQQSGCTADYLSHLFRRSTGEHLVACINRLRLERAASLLAEGRLAGKEVAWACGYASHSYFIRSFRARYGMTPTDWCTRQAGAAGHVR